ncbi:lipocalin family protein [Dietzia psychralcaliphila]|uniref:Lipocalin n=1 Tax=Dietzia psychralcaliphila TaxID=139021 RepID=A0AAD0JU03_9ACTN|nr:lipocalin family protein [Dietzia psychralcaliphila]AWH96724.1 lipocalin [Dietzia psychralcaliphila]PTM89355.1 apolipoprotein D and lipocalin family protein [Dietzia psychralcaliphila]
MTASRRSRFRSLVTALAVAPLLAAGLGAAPVAGAQDLTDGGRLGGGSSQLLLPDGVAVGSIGGPELEQVGYVDPDRYVGKWYQVAAVPQPYTLQCTNDTTAEYARISPDTISVRNSCGSAISSDSVIEGEATIRDAGTNASLRVNFPQVPFQDENGPVNYRITYLADDYSVAVVGDPSRSSGFVLSRSPELGAEQWSTVRDVVEARGWWPCAFLTVPMAGGRGDVTPLCLLP